MSRRFVALVVALCIFLSAGGATTVALATAAPPSLTVVLVSDTGTPLEQGAVQLLVPGKTASVMVRTDRLGRGRFVLPDGESFWIRAWARAHDVVERPYLPSTDGYVVTLRVISNESSLAGIVTDERGRPVQGAALTVWNSQLGVQGTALTDARGVYRIEQLRSGGGYSLLVEAASFQPFTQADLTLGAGARTQLDVSLTPTRGTITGEVAEATTSLPLEDLTVELSLSGWGVIERTRTDAYGYFRITAPPSGNGTYEIRVSGLGYETAALAGIALQPGGWTDFSGGNRLTLNPLFSEISGSVLNESGEALPKTTVQLQRMDMGTVETGLTDETGFFSFSRIPAGTYRVRALPASDQLQGASPWVTLAGGDRTTVDISANLPDRTSYGASAVVGTVRNHLGNPVSGATVFAARGTETATAITDAQGRYRIPVQANVEDELDPDEQDTSSGFYISVSKTGFIPSDLFSTGNNTPPPALFDVRYRTTNRADFTLYPSEGTLAGRVTDDRGSPVPGVQVTLIQEGTNQTNRTTTDAQGRYVFPGLPVAKQARYLPVVRGADFYTSSMASDGTMLAHVSLSPGSSVTHSLVVRPALGTISGMVRSGQRTAAADALVTITRPSDGGTWSSVAAEDGAYSLQVPVGPNDQFVVRATMAGARPGIGANTVTLATNPGAVANLSVTPYSTVAGRVYDGVGNPAGGAVVTLWTEGGQTPVAFANTNNLGSYSIANLDPGRRYFVMVQADPSIYGALAPGEPILTPLFLTAPGETTWADIISPDAVPQNSSGPAPGK